MRTEPTNPCRVCGQELLIRDPGVGQVVHYRQHVEHGEAVELCLNLCSGTTRQWVPAGKTLVIARYLAIGYRVAGQLQNAR